MPELEVDVLLRTGSVSVREVRCAGTCLHKGPEECASSLQLVFPYRGVYARHLGSDPAVAEANQVLVFNPGEGYRISHPVRGGDASVVVVADEEVLRELVPAPLQRRGALALDVHARRIDPRAQLLTARLRHGRRVGTLEPLEAESHALALVRCAFGERAPRRGGATAAKRRLVDRAKLVLASDGARRWTLADVASRVGASPVYLTQLFQDVEGLPLYRYHLHLRLARALELLAEGGDLSAIAFALGFSSHSHFSAAFRRVYGIAPSRLPRAPPAAAPRRARRQARR